MAFKGRQLDSFADGGLWTLTREEYLRSRGYPLQKETTTDVTLDNPGDRASGSTSTDSGWCA